MLNGHSHARYDHRCRARDLHVRCPRCHGRALATKDSEQGQSVLISELAGTWDVADWQVRCDSCPYRTSGLAFEALPALFYRLAAGGVELWAYNRDHLEMLGRFLEGRDVDHHPYGWLDTYAHKDWLTKKNRSALARAVGAALHLE